MTKQSHTPTVCVRVPRTERYSFRNWSIAFQCPSCGAQQRRSLNFLGQRKLVCSGLKFDARAVLAEIESNKE